MGYTKVLLYTIILAVNAYNFIECKKTEIIEEKPENYEQVIEKFEKHLERIKMRFSPTDDACMPEVFDSEENCIPSCRVYTPFMIKENNTDYYVLQGPDFRQNIKTVKCMSENHPCFTTLTEMNNKLTFKCNTMQSTMSIYVYDPKTKETYLRNFEFDSCCTCERCGNK